MEYHRVWYFHNNKWHQYDILMSYYSAVCWLLAHYNMGYVENANVGEILYRFNC